MRPREVVLSYSVALLQLFAEAEAGATLNGAFHPGRLIRRGANNGIYGQQEIHRPW